jgi:hypothetical protein
MTECSKCEFFEKVGRVSYCTHPITGRHILGRTWRSVPETPPRWCQKGKFELTIRGTFEKGDLRIRTTSTLAPEESVRFYMAAAMMTAIGDGGADMDLDAWDRLCDDAKSRVRALAKEKIVRPG